MKELKGFAVVQLHRHFTFRGFEILRIAQDDNHCSLLHFLPKFRTAFYTSLIHKSQLLYLHFANFRV